MSKVIFVVGPTSSGKTEVAWRLAKRIGGEVVSCDSMQIYQGMDILTRVPSKDVLREVPHHLIGVISPEEEYNAALFAAKAEEIISEVTARGKVPVVAGGTGLYMKALVDGIFEAPPKDNALREALLQESTDKGALHLHERLKAIDPESAGKLHVNDTTRIIRAIEVFELTGEKISEKKKEAEGISKRYDLRIFALDLPRKMLYQRIDDSVDRMFSSGILEEVGKLNRRKLSKTARKALGIKEVSAYLDMKKGLEETIEDLKKNTRRYAKRQLTWFRGDERVEWIDAMREPAEVVEDILKRI